MTWRSSRRPGGAVQIASSSPPSSSRRVWPEGCPGAVVGFGDESARHAHRSRPTSGQPSVIRPHFFAFLALSCGHLVRRHSPLAHGPTVATSRRASRFRDRRTFPLSRGEVQGEILPKANSTLWAPEPERGPLVRFRQSPTRQAHRARKADEDVRAPVHEEREGGS